MSDINRFGPYGLNDLEATGFGLVYPQPDPTRYVRYYNDFHVYTAGDWTVTETQGGATQAIVAGHGGILALVNSATEDDVNSIQLTQETFKFAAARKTWLRARFKVSDATESDLLIGLAITDTSPLASLPSDGVFLYKEDGSTTLSLHVRKDAASSTSTVGTMASDTYVKVEVYFDGNLTWRVFLNGAEVQSIVGATNLPDDEELTVTLALQAGSANARTLSVDYIEAVMER